MHRLLAGALALLLSCASAAPAQNTNTNTPKPAAPNANAAPAQKRKPPFRATKDQITQAQNLLKQRGFYAGDADGKLNPDTRAGLKKYQEAEGLKVTGTLNAGTLQKMSIQLTDRQKEWLKTTL
ncbi:MAG TPA: peptidoglycan-binding domain-containing protein [Pyrinomonadaceae bacterium]|jgi:peptidoglycan hydrolase-like protein with peptidoglycan-binding domain